MQLLTVLSTMATCLYRTHIPSFMSTVSGFPPAQSTSGTMGNANANTVGSNKPLIAQRHFEATIHRRFIKDTVVTLEFQDQFWSQPREGILEIKDVAHDKVLFKVPPVAAVDDEQLQPKRKLLLDAYGVPVVGMEEHEVLPAAAQQRKFAVIPDGFAAPTELFRFETAFNIFTDVRLQLNLPAQDTRVVVMGRWLTREAAIGVQRKDGNFFMIGRVYTAGSLLDRKYRIDVAPGVDLALIVLFAAALDQENRKFETSTERLRQKRLTKEHAKREKKATKAKRKADDKAAHEDVAVATAG